LARQLKNEELRRLKDDPQKLAFREFNRLIYFNNPRGRFASHSSIAKIKRDDLVKFHNKFFRPDNIMFAVSGDISKEQAVYEFSRHFGNRNTKETPIDVPLPPDKSKAGIFTSTKKFPNLRLSAAGLRQAKQIPIFMPFQFLISSLAAVGSLQEFSAQCAIMKDLPTAPEVFIVQDRHIGVFGAYAFTKTSSTMKALSLIN